EGWEGAKPRLFAGGRCPRRPFLLATNGGGATPVLPTFANGDAVADRLALRQDVIKKSATGIDDDGAGGFVARVLDDVTPFLLRNDRLPVGQIGHQLLVTRTPASLCRRRQCPLHAAAEHQGDNCKGNPTHGCNFPLFLPQARRMRPSRTCSTVVVRGTNATVEVNVSLARIQSSHLRGPYAKNV